MATYRVGKRPMPKRIARAAEELSIAGIYYESVPPGAISVQDIGKACGLLKSATHRAPMGQIGLKSVRKVQSSRMDRRRLAFPLNGIPAENCDAADWSRHADIPLRRWRPDIPIRLKTGTG